MRQLLPRLVLMMALWLNSCGPTPPTYPKAAHATGDTRPARNPQRPQPFINRTGVAHTTDGARIRYLLRGQPGGPKILCLEGTMAALPQMRHLEATALVAYRWGAPLPVPGSTPRMQGSIGPHILSDIETLRAHLGWKSMTLYGFSHSGLEAVEYALAHPQKVSRLILEDPLLHQPGHIQEGLYARLKALNKDSTGPARAEHTLLQSRLQAGSFHALDLLRAGEMRGTLPKFRNAVGMFAFYARLRHLMGLYPALRPGQQSPPPTQAQFWQLMTSPGVRGLTLPRYSSLNVAGQLGMPVMVIQGAQDPLTRPIWAKKFVAAARQGTLILIPQCGHAPSMEQGATVRKALLRFLGFVGRKSVRPLTPPGWSPPFLRKGPLSSKQKNKLAQKLHAMSSFRGLLTFACVGLTRPSLTPTQWGQTGLSKDARQLFVQQVCARIFPPKNPAGE